MADPIARLREANSRMERQDPALSQELQGLREAPRALLPAAIRVPGITPAVEIGSERVDRLPLDFQGNIQFDVESIVLRTGRPVLAIQRDAATLTFADPDSTVWRERLQAASAHVTAAARAVGRIEVQGHPLDWIGTGWLIREDVVVTNRHVAAEFGQARGAAFVFRQGLDGRLMTADIDFLEELDRTDSLAFRLEEVLHIEDSGGPDLAFLRVTPQAGHQLATPIRLASSAVADDLVAVIGYPARDSRIPDQPLMDRIFGNVYDKKRLAPGRLTRADQVAVCHDCSTLGGNSGSVVMSLTSGDAVGLHFAGRFLQNNFAVPGLIVGERLDQVLPAGPAGGRLTPQTQPERPGSTHTYVIPLRVTIEIGEPQIDPARTVSPIAPAFGHVIAAGDDDVFTEARAEDYRDRPGYVASFLGDGEDVALPAIVAGDDDVLTYSVDGRTERVLPYEHFSVLMSRTRRMCRYSAVNIDGRQSLSMARVGWRTDPRIPLEAQIRKECYGNPPRFSRGHMTRREDPVWGSRESAGTGNADSMHVTNAVPQMQPFNGGIWLDLEDYALQHARQDRMRISVFTGPILRTDDPVIFDIRVPVEFWKVIAFIHDETGELCATGYTMSQRDFLRPEEFVFGRHRTAQRSIASIEQRTGLSFGRLTGLDPFDELENIAPELTSVDQIRLIRRQ